MNEEPLSIVSRQLPLHTEIIKLDVAVLECFPICAVFIDKAVFARLKFLDGDDPIDAIGYFFDVDGDIPGRV